MYEQQTVIREAREGLINATVILCLQHWSDLDKQHKQKTGPKIYEKESNQNSL